MTLLFWTRNILISLSILLYLLIKILFVVVPLQDPPANSGSTLTEPSPVHPNRPGTSIRLSDQPSSSNNQTNNGCDNNVNINVGSTNCDTNLHNNHHVQNSLNTYTQNRQQGILTK